MPVPRVTTSKRLHSRPEPKWCSPNAHATASLSITTGAPSSAVSNPAKSKPENQGRVSGLEMVPLGNRTGPLAPIPTPSKWYPAGNRPVTTAAVLETRREGRPHAQFARGHLGGRYDLAVGNYGEPGTRPSHVNAHLSQVSTFHWQQPQ